VRYADPLALMRDLRAMPPAARPPTSLVGRARRPLPRAILARAALDYAEALRRCRQPADLA
jgi:hypothetical protein